MKKNTHRLPAAGFTVAEMMIAIGVVSILGLVFFRVLQTGLVLFSKNTAVNNAHEAARQGMARLTRDIHASVSIPEMRTVDATISPIALATPAPSPTPIVSGSGATATVTSPSFAAVSFQNIAAGPNYIWKDPGSASLIMIKDGGTKPIAGQHLVVPFWGSLYEADITQVTASGTANHSNVFLTGNVGTQINARAFGSTAYAITYYTDRVAYAVTKGNYVSDNSGLYTGADASGNVITGTGKIVKYVLAPTGTSPGQRYRFENGELHLYKQRYAGSSFYWQDTATVARNITSPTPFSVPLNSGNSFNNKYVAVKLSTSDPGTSNRSYASTNSLLDTQIDYRTAITLIQ